MDLLNLFFNPLWIPIEKIVNVSVFQRIGTLIVQCLFLSVEEPVNKNKNLLQNCRITIFYFGFALK